MHDFRVLVCHHVRGAFGFITDGWLNALNDIGITAKRWDGSLRSWSEFKPSLYLGSSGHKQDIPNTRNRGDCRVAIHVNQLGPVRTKLTESDDDVQWTMAQRPDVVFGYGFEKDRAWWRGWDRSGFPWVPMATAGDATLFHPSNGTHDRYDVVYLGGRWRYKAENIDKYLLPLLRSGRCNYRLHGWGEWPQGVSSGELPDNNAPAFLASGKVGPCISEPHTTTCGIDIPERVFKVVLSGAVAVHDTVAGFPLETVESAKDPTHYANVICDVLEFGSEYRHTLSKRQYAEVISGHTYHHRLANMLKFLGFYDASKALLDRISQYSWDRKP